MAYGAKIPPVKPLNSAAIDPSLDCPGRATCHRSGGSVTEEDLKIEAETNSQNAPSNTILAVSDITRRYIDAVFRGIRCRALRPARRWERLVLTPYVPLCRHTLLGDC